MNALLIKSFVAPFYKAFMGVFVLILIVFGVFMRAQEHIAIAQAIALNPAFMIILFLIFTTYAFFQTRFQLKLLLQKNYLVFRDLAFYLPIPFYKSQLLIWSYNHLLMLIYALFLSAQCALFDKWWSILAIWAYLCTLYFANSTLLYFKLRRPYPDESSIIRLVQKKSVKKHFVFWFLTHLFHERPLLVLVTKFFSLLMLNIFFSSYYSGDYDIRWLQFGVVVASYINLFIWSEKDSFETKKLSGFLNLPASVMRKVSNHGSSFIQLLLPELILIAYRSFTLKDIVSMSELLILFLSLNAGLYTLLRFTKDKSLILRNTFVLFFLLLFAILYGVSAFILILCCLVPFWILMKSDYQV